jgi:MYXO-CTERM domain-containing protein
MAAGSICFNAKLDIDEPPTPTLTAAGGETTARVGLSGLGTTDDILGYRLCRGGTCGGDGGAGTALTEADCSDDITMESSPSTVNVDVSALPLDTGVSVAVILVDRAHNESGISNTVCASHVNVGGFWERFCAERGFTDDEAGIAACRAQYQSCSCRTVGHGGRTGMGLFLLAAAVLGIVIRRKR